MGRACFDLNKDGRLSFAFAFICCQCALTYNGSCLARLEPRPISAQPRRVVMKADASAPLPSYWCGSDSGQPLAGQTHTLPPPLDGGGSVDSGGAAGRRSVHTGCGVWGDPRGTDTQAWCGVLGEIWKRQPGLDSGDSDLVLRCGPGVVVPARETGDKRWWAGSLWLEPRSGVLGDRDPA